MASKLETYLKEFKLVAKLPAGHVYLRLAQSVCESRARQVMDIARRLLVTTGVLQDLLRPLIHLTLN